MEESGEEDSTQGPLGGPWASAQGHEQPPPPACTAPPSREEWLASGILIPLLPGKKKALLAVWPQTNHFTSLNLSL